MIGRKYCVLLLCLYLILGGGCLLWIGSRQAVPPVDMVEVNRIGKETAAQMAEGTLKRIEDAPYEYVVTDSRGQVVFATADGLSGSWEEAVKRRDTVIDIERDGRILGRVLVDTKLSQELWNEKRSLMSACLIFMVSLAAAAGIYLAYLNRRVLQPFRQLKEFSRNVAMGNLDLPLPMDRGHVFGPFTESFDLMRDQLKEARRREAAADREKKELVASLSHDIKTPVTSIKLVSELLLVTQKEEGLREKLTTINQKAEQIDLLISNMLHASLEDLGELEVKTGEESSTLLTEMIKRADYLGRVEMEEIPECLLLMDPLRMEQVLDNIIQNSYKYAGTAIQIHCGLEANALRLELRDFGPGVAEEDLPKLCRKFYRGSSLSGESKEGSGLGLYIARYLMERMGGELSVYNRSDGFSVEVIIRLA